MATLEQVQTAFMSALDNGPGYMPEGLFAGPAARALLGMRVHANTISHARLVALEDTFPKTRSLVGHEHFNKLSRLFLDRPEPSAQPLAHIGRQFPLFLSREGEPEPVTELAAFEWAWLTSYHAADARALQLGDLAGKDAASLLDVVLRRHPAANFALLSDGLRSQLAIEIPELANAGALLITRPSAGVIVAAASLAMLCLFARLDQRQTIGNLFAACTEPERKDQLQPDDFMPALVTLIEAGALEQVD
ncbi:MAG: putative DNA-binding domain-containing protein [Sphingomonadales bacterium]|nr:putative DNA-binding domain-containing protein [Sphingomonadales bacterium]MDE2568003.1 putative DNA-binding domain-containing protein [Sphingomonadales bacterium]